MARKSKIRFEWDFDRPGLLLAIRDKGKITYPELIEAINGNDVDLQEHIFSMQFIVDRECCQPIGWEPYDEEPEGDTWELWDVVDGETCPLCGKLTPPQYCPECGKYVFPLTEMGGNGNHE